MSMRHSQDHHSISTGVCDFDEAKLSGVFADSLPEEFGEGYHDYASEPSLERRARWVNLLPAKAGLRRQ